MFVFTYQNEANLSLLLNGKELITECRLGNDTTEDWQDVVVCLRPLGSLIAYSEARIDMLKSGQEVRITSLSLMPNLESLYQLTEGTEAQFVVEVTVKGESIFKLSYALRLMPYDYWLGLNVRPELISCFCQPNLPEVERICFNAAQLLEKRFGMSHMNGYISGNPNYVRAQIAAIYDALRQEGLHYVLNPASFEDEGQRVRMADRVLTEKRGTCLDTSLLIASCFENAGLEPLIVFFEGHAFVGARLVPDTCPLTLDDPSYLTKGISNGVNDLVLIESTCLCNKEDGTFEIAVSRAEEKLRQAYSLFELMVDIIACRNAKIRPLPQLRMDGAGIWHIAEETAERPIDNELRHKQRHELQLDEEKDITKQDIWERKLLDLTLNNTLINLYRRGNVIPLVVAASNLSDDDNPSGIDHIEKIMRDNKAMEIKPVSKYVSLSENDKSDKEAMEQLVNSPYVVPLISEHLEKKEFLAAMFPNELKDSLVSLYRQSNTSLEENGTNSLYLTIGELKWYECEQSEREIYAPILLLPIEFVRKNLTSYSIKLREEEMIINSSILELLKHKFDLDLNLQNPLPQDENGVDVRKILSYVRQYIRKMPRWDVNDTAYIGMFSFDKFVMWNDIHTNAEKLQENDIVKGLVDGKYVPNGDSVNETIDVREADMTLSPASMALPLSADSSQLEAIMEAAKGKSFVLYGPPGTGKSQTITNIISHMLFLGKRVLFVAEKKAALEVVRTRLERIGINPFCLELHSNKATKSHFLKQLESTIEFFAKENEESFEDEAEQLFTKRKVLASTINALHDTKQYGLSLYDCIEGYESLKPQMNGKEEMQISESNIIGLGVLSHGKLDEFARQLEALDTIAQICGSPYNHPLADLHLTENVQIGNITELLKTVSACAVYWQNEFDVLQRRLGLSVPNSYIGLHEMHIAVIELMNGKYENINSSSPMVNETIDRLKREELLRMKIMNSCDESIFSLPVAQLRRQWYEACHTFIFFRKSAKKKWISSIQKYCPDLIEPNVEPLLVDLEEYQTLSMLREQNRNNGGVVWLKKKLETILLEMNIFRDKVAKDIKTDILSMTFDQMKQSADLWLQNLNIQNLRDWLHWDRAIQDLNKSGLGFVFDDMQKRQMSGKEMADEFRCSLLHSLAEKIISNDTELTMFHGLLFEQQIAEYRRLTSEFQDLSKRELVLRLISKERYIIPEEMSTLKRYIKNHGRGSSIRHIIEKIPSPLKHLCPCMLMSPMSVAQYLSLCNEKFDLVIFDEASQMPTAEAVGAVGRGKNLIVVGDPKQLPPTSFFNTKTVVDFEASIDDMESILDDCIALSIPEHYLTWHYRSKHESLITFSNNMYYNCRLHTFPSYDNKISKVTLQHIDGVYDKGKSRSNKAEAEAVVDEIIRRLNDEELRKQSIGVVSFSAAQQNLIEDVLTERLKNNKELANLAFNCDEPIFIKNLENVQGDERDVILFSVGYGPDKQGKVSMNFGPLNNAGGERRLNVAVSRARYEMKVFSTLRADQIDLNRTQAAGVAGLKRFLEYAETGRLPFEESEMRAQKPDALRHCIATFLRNNGYLVDDEVGRSEFRVDLAVSSPENPEQYICGILLDGQNYFGVKTVNDRENVQPSVLSSLGWNILRVWSLDWYMNQTRAESELINKINNLQINSLTLIPQHYYKYNFLST